MRRARFLVVAWLAVTAVWTAVPVSAGHSWSNYHWSRSANPFTVVLGDNVSAAWDGDLGTASTDWLVTGVIGTSVTGGGAGNPATCSPTDGRVEVCNAAYGTNGWLGLAQIWITSGGHIVKGVVKVNDTYFDDPAYGLTTDARQHVLCQEVGHTLGLDHQKGPNAKSCMNDQWGLNNPAYAHPNQHDYDQLKAIYCHLDGVSNCGGGKGGKKGAKASKHGPEVSQDGEYTVLTWITTP